MSKIANPLTPDATKKTVRRRKPTAKQMARWQLFDSVHQGIRTGNVIKREIVVQACKIELARNLGVPKQRLQLRAEVDVGAAPVQIKLFDPQAIPRQYQPTARFGPESYREHSP